MKAYHSRLGKIRGIRHPDLDTARDFGISTVDIQQTRLSRPQPSQLRDITIVSELGDLASLQVQ
jgi:hypothetical protein